MKPIIITGSRGAGKTTLMGNIKNDLITANQLHLVTMASMDDLIAHKYAHDTDAQAELMTQLGDYTKDGIRKLILNADKLELDRINRVLDRVFTPIALDLIIDHINAGKPLILEWAMFHETCATNRLLSVLREQVDVVCVFIDEATRKNRILARDTHLTDYEVNRLESLQFPQETKKLLSDVAVNPEKGGYYYHLPIQLNESLLRAAKSQYDFRSSPYHNWSHAMSVAREVNHLGQEFAIAAIFHDIVYDGSHDDVERSAAMMVQMVKKQLQPGTPPHIIRQAEKLIMLTKTHEDSHDLTEEERQFIDADMLFGLRVISDVRHHEKMIRLEYQHVPTREFNKGRVAFLKSLLERDTIMLSEKYSDKEEKVRADVMKRIEVYTKKPKTKDK